MEENLNVDEVYDAIDKLNMASKIAFNQADIELEAYCEASLGEILHKGLRKDSKAMTHFHNMVRLAISRRPKDLTLEKWYRSAVLAMWGILK